MPRAGASEVGPAAGPISDFGAVIAAHAGPGLIGLSWRWEQDH